MSAQVALAPRAWVGDSPFPWPPLRSLPDGAAVRACFCVAEFQVARTRSDQPYLRLTLADRYGQVEARAWNHADELAAWLQPGGYVGAQGRIEFFNGQLQLCVDALEPVDVELDDLPLFLPHSRRAQPDMERELRDLVASVTEPALRALLEACLGPDSDVGPGFRLAPAAKYNHHAFLGGLLEHTLSVAHVCDRLAAHYGPGVDRDLLVTGALLHDVGKVREIGARAGFPYTDEGKLLGHILLGLELVATAARRTPDLEPARLLLLQHLIASHQGRYEWQSPREPATIEALILHYADDLDAKLQQVRELIGASQGPWTPYERSFRREFLRATRPPSAAPCPAPEPPDIPSPPVAERPAPSAERPPAHTAGAAGGAAARSARAHGASSFHRLSEDTLDLFGERA